MRAFFYVARHATRHLRKRYLNARTKRSYNGDAIGVFNLILTTTVMM
jgi:hypothetical protein